MKKLFRNKTADSELRLKKDLSFTAKPCNLSMLGRPFTGAYNTPAFCAEQREELLH